MAAAAVVKKTLEFHLFASILSIYWHGAEYGRVWAGS